MFASTPRLSPKRLLLCSRENANRVASRIFDESPGRISIVRTNNPMQPFRVCTLPAFGERVEVEMVS